MGEEFIVSLIEIPSPTEAELGWFQAVNNKISDLLSWFNKPADPEDELAALICTLPEIMDGNLPNWGWSMNFHNRDGVNGLWIESPSDGNIDAMISLLHAFLLRFRPGKYLTMEWAYISNPPRPGGFGGGAAFITARCLHVNDTSVFLEDLEDQHRQQWISQPTANKLMS